VKPRPRPCLLTPPLLTVGTVPVTPKGGLWQAQPPHLVRHSRSDPSRGRSCPIYGRCCPEKIKTNALCPFVPDPLVCQQFLVLLFPCRPNLLCFLTPPFFSLTRAPPTTGTGMAPAGVFARSPPRHELDAFTPLGVSPGFVFAALFLPWCRRSPARSIFLTQIPRPAPDSPPSPFFRLDNPCPPRLTGWARSTEFFFFPPLFPRAPGSPLRALKLFFVFYSCPCLVQNESRPLPFPPSIFSFSPR